MIVEKPIKGKEKEKLHARRILCKHTVFLSYID